MEKPLTILRYDMLCFEGIALMLNIFLGRKPYPNYRLIEPASGKLEQIIVKENVRQATNDYTSTY